MFKGNIVSRWAFNLKKMFTFVEEWMNVAKTLAVLVIIAVLASSQALAGEACVKEDVRKSVEYAADILAAKGVAAFPELEKFRFCDQKGYVWVADMEGVVLMHHIHKLVGVDQMYIQDPNGKYFNAEMVAKVKKSGAGWVSYRRLNPVSKIIEPKCSYVKATTMDGKKVWVGAGVYGISEATCR